MEITNQIDISIVIPFYKRQLELQHLLNCISALDLETINIETIIVVDGCKFENDKFLPSYYPSLRLRFIFNERNFGPGFSRNAGAIHSRGKFIWFLDTDVSTISSDVAINLINVLRSSSNILAAGGIIEDTVQGLRVMRPVTLYSLHFLMQKLIPSVNYKENVDFLSTSNFFIHKSLFDSVGGFDEKLKMYEDNDLCIRLRYKFSGSFYQSINTLMLHAPSSTGRDSGHFDYFNHEMNYLKNKCETRNVLLQRYYPWRLLFLLFIEPISLLFFLNGVRKNQFHLSRIKISRIGVKKFDFYIKGGLLLISYTIKGTILAARLFLIKKAT